MRSKIDLSNPFPHMLSWVLLFGAVCAATAGLRPEPPSAPVAGAYFRWTHGPGAGRDQPARHCGARASRA